MRLEVLPTLETITRSKVENKTCIVIDVFRATSTMVTAIYNGCGRIIPSATIEKTRELARDLGPEVLTGGERKGRPIAGFNLGNSPREYNKETIAGKTVVMSTTNGTRAIKMAAKYDSPVLIGSMLNARATARRACELGGDITIVCAGTMGRLSLEDTLAAGTIIREILREDSGVRLRFDHALLAYRLSLSYGDRPDKGLYEAYNAWRLTTLGKERDIHWCARLNIYPIVVQHIGGVVSG